MCEALDDHDGSVSIGGRIITNFRFVDDEARQDKQRLIFSKREVE